jgi:hypothetical protein
MRTTTDYEEEETERIKRMITDEETDGKTTTGDDFYER